MRQTRRRPVEEDGFRGRLDRQRDARLRLHQPPHVLHHGVRAEIVRFVRLDRPLDDVGQPLAELVRRLHVVADEAEARALQRGTDLQGALPLRVRFQEAAVGMGSSA